MGEPGSCSLQFTTGSKLEETGFFFMHGIVNDSDQFLSTRLVEALDQAQGELRKKSDMFEVRYRS